MNYNKSIILGRLTREVETRALPSGKKIVSFGLATNRVWTEGQDKKQETEFHDVVCFGKLAEVAEKYLLKGSVVLVEGRLKTRNWVDSHRFKHYRTEIIAEDIQF